MLLGCFFTPAPAETALSICWARFVHFFINCFILFLVVNTCCAALSNSVPKNLWFCNFSTYGTNMTTKNFKKQLRVFTRSTHPENGRSSIRASTFFLEHDAISWSSLGVAFCKNSSTFFLSAVSTSLISSSDSASLKVE